MDLLTARNRLMMHDQLVGEGKSPHYETAADLVADVELVWSNAELYVAPPLRRPRARRQPTRHLLSRQVQWKGAKGCLVSVVLGATHPSRPPTHCGVTKFQDSEVNQMSQSTKAYFDRELSKVLERLRSRQSKSRARAASAMDGGDLAEEPARKRSQARSTGSSRRGSRLPKRYR